MDGIVLKKQRRQRRQNISQKFVNVKGFDICNQTDDWEQYHVYQLGIAYKSKDLRISCTDIDDSHEKNVFSANTQDDSKYSDQPVSQIFYEHDSAYHNEDIFEKERSHVRFSFKDLPIFSQESVLLSKRVTARFAIVVGITTMALGTFLFVGTSFAVKDRVDGAGKRAITAIELAMNSLNENNLTASGDNIDQAYQEFLFAADELDKINGFATFISQFIPGASKLSSGNHIIEAGKYLTHSAQELHSVIPAVINKNDALVGNDGKHVSFLVLYQILADRVSGIHADVILAREHIDKVRLDDVPVEYQDTFMEMKKTLPIVESSLHRVLATRSAVEELLGANGSRTYLFLFQNNHEMRATGGFIGSYGILKINDGHIDKLIVDDIYNPDGQLIDRVVPPLPIQKISADWSLHDSNWFVDFPLSAKKAMDFYERTGGPTVDGVIAITPTMMEKMLEITGPVHLSQYDLMLTSENFMEIMQDEVEDEEEYKKISTESAQDEMQQEDEEMEKEQKRPKKILSDLMPIMIDKLSDRKSPEHLAQMSAVISNGFKERHIMMYMTNDDVQEIIESSGWSGSVLQTDKDYLSVVNTNINGFKTDGMIDEHITHTAEIDNEGYIIDTVRIRRVHKGGKTGFPWWDSVNSNYMRIYVPQGSQLLSVEGHTREINGERLDYDALGYERDHDVELEENNMYIDEETGTRIYDEYNKTVFANWVYVSPQESVIVTYKYRLPFRADFDSDKDGRFGSYAILFQKQSGSEHSFVESDVVLNENFSQVWHSHDSDDISMKNDLKIDRYHGTVFRINALD